MTLSEREREALRGGWLGNDLPEDLARELEGRPQTGHARRRQREMRRFLLGLAATTDRRVRRLVMTYGTTAVAKLVDLIRDAGDETARKAAVDLLKTYDRCSKLELDDARREASGSRDRLADRLTDDQARRLLAALADADAARVLGQEDGDEADDPQ